MAKKYEVIEDWIASKNTEFREIIDVDISEAANLGEYLPKRNSGFLIQNLKANNADYIIQNVQGDIWERKVELASVIKKLELHLDIESEQQPYLIHKDRVIYNNMKVVSREIFWPWILTGWRVDFIRGEKDDGSDDMFQDTMQWKNLTIKEDVKSSYFWKPYAPKN